MAWDRRVYSDPLAAALFSVSPGQWDEEVLPRVCPEGRWGAGWRARRVFQMTVSPPVSSANNILSYQTFNQIWIASYVVPRDRQAGSNANANQRSSARFN